MDWLKIDRKTIRSLSDLIQSELYSIVVMLRAHAQFIRVPPFFGGSYRNPAHTVNNALERLRWLIPGVVKDFGSCPEETIRQRFNIRGLPLHLQPYSLNSGRAKRGEVDLQEDPGNQLQLQHSAPGDQHQHWQQT